jgi:hypothetical protein
LELSIKEVGVKLAKTALVVELPFLGWPGISQVVDYLLGKIANYFYLSTAQFATFQIIEAQAKAELEAYNLTIEELKKAVVSEDQAAIEKAREEFKKKLQDLIQFNGEARVEK